MATKTYWLQSICVFLLLFTYCTSLFDIEELKTVHYGLDIASEPVVVTEKIPIGAIELVSKYGQQYRCSFPDHSVRDKEKEEQEKVAMETGILQLLKPLESGECLFKTKDWWSYEFCYGKYIRQYHAEDGVIKGEIIYLGYYESDYDWNNETKKDERLKSKSSFFRYHSQTYINGTKCDLTQIPRKSEVRFLCEEGAEDYIVRIDEPQTCVYIITVNTGRLCSHPYLKPLTPKKPISITCNPLLSSEQYQEYLLDVEIEQKRKEEAEAAKARAEEEKKKLEEKRKLEEKIRLETSEKEKSGDRKDKQTQSHETDTELDRISSPVETYLKNILTKEMKNIQDRLADDIIQKKIKPQPPGTVVDNTKSMDTGSATSQFEQGNEMLKKIKPQPPGAVLDNSRMWYKTKSENEQVKDPNKKREKELEAEEEDEQDVYDEFDKELEYVKKTYKNKRDQFVNMKDKVRTVIESQFDDIVSEAEETLGEKIDKKEAFQQLSATLDKLIKKLEKTEKDISEVDKLLQDHSEADTEKKSSQIKGQLEAPPSLAQPKTANDRVKVRVTRIKSGSMIQEDENISDKTRKHLENTVKDGLEKAGLETGGGKIQVKIITSGYYNPDDDSIHILSEEESASFQNLIVAVLGGTNEAKKEEERQKKLEDNYSKVWYKRSHKPMDEK